MNGSFYGARSSRLKVKGHELQFSRGHDAECLGTFLPTSSPALWGIVRVQSEGLMRSETNTNESGPLGATKRMTFFGLAEPPPSQLGGEE